VNYVSQTFGFHSDLRSPVRMSKLKSGQIQRGSHTQLRCAQLETHLGGIHPLLYRYLEILQFPHCLALSNRLQPNQTIMLLLFLGLFPILSLPGGLGHFAGTKSLLGIQGFLRNDFRLQLCHRFPQLYRMAPNMFPVHLLPALQKVIRRRKAHESKTL